MFCKNCGAQIDDKAVICPHCGVATNANVQTHNSNEPNHLAIIGFILAFLLPPVGVILSNIAFYKARKLGGNGKGLAYAGCVIGAIMSLGCFILLIALL